MNSKELNDYFSDWNILLDDNINTMLNTKFNSKYTFDTMEKWDCMVDDINRLNNVIEFHDILADTSEKLLLEAINNTADKLEDILFEFLDFYINVPLDIKLNKKKIIDLYLKKYNGEENE